MDGKQNDVLRLRRLWRDMYRRETVRAYCKARVCEKNRIFFFIFNVAE